MKPLTRLLLEAAGFGLLCFLLVMALADVATDITPAQAAALVGLAATMGAALMFRVRR